MPTSSPQHTVLSWSERYRPERLFYLLLVSMILSAPANLLQSLILQGPASLAPSQWSQLYIVNMARTYPLSVIAIALLAIGLALYGFRLDMRHQKLIAEKERQAFREEAKSQFQPVHEIVQGVADRQKTQDEGIQQITKQTAQIQHIVAQQTIPLIPVRYIKPETLNLGDDQSATFPYLSTVHPEVYEQSTQVLRAALDDPQQRGLLVTGAPMAGKTRLVYQTMYEIAPNWLTIIWTRGLTAAAIPAPETLINQRIILFLDDLQQYAESERNGDEWTSTSNDFPLDRLYVTLMQRAVQIVLVATCRATDLSRAETTSSLRWFFEKVQRVEIPFLADDRQDAIITLLKDTSPTMDYHDDDFDGTLGSLLLGLSRKREQYLELKKQRNPGYLVLRAMKVLNIAGVTMQTRERIRAMVIQALGARMLNDDVIWSSVCEALEEQQFLTQQNTSLTLRKDVYFDKVITDYPTQIRDALLQARHVFHVEGDSEALMSMGWVHSERKEFTDMLETNTLAVELAPGNARTHYAQGAALSYLRKHEEALACFDKALDIDPSFAVGWNNKGYMLDALQRYEEALVAYQQAIHLNPSYIRAWYNKGITLIYLARSEEALLAYEQAILLNPKFADAWYNKGIALSILERKEEAQTAFEEALTLATSASDAASGWYTKAKMLVALQRTDEALEAYDEAIRLNSQFADAYFHKGQLLLNLNRYDEALVYFDKGLTLNPRDSEGWYNKGYVLSDLKRYDEALLCYEKALTINPQYDVAWNDKGYVLVELKRYDEAFLCYDEALALNPQYPNPWRHKGNALRGLQRFEEALLCYAKALELNPQYTGAWYDKGTVLHQLGRNDEACAAFDKAVDYDIANQLNPEYVKYYEEALVAYEKAILVNPHYYDAWDNRGILLYKLGRNEEARTNYKEALHLNPKYAELVEKALIDSEEAIRLNSRNSTAWYYKGIALNRLGREKEAQIAFEEAIRLNLQNRHGDRSFTSDILKYISPDLIRDEYLDEEIVIYVVGRDTYDRPTFSYIEMSGSDLKKVLAKLQAHEHFNYADFGTVLAEGNGIPSQELLDEMNEKYHMHISNSAQEPMPTILPKSFDDESK